MEKVKGGILGTAEIAQGAIILGMLNVNNCQLYAIAGRNPEKVAEFIKEFNIEKGYTNYDELLDDPKVEAVYIPLPNSIHYEWVLKAIHKKKHVLCEKPMGLNSEQVEAMIEALLVQRILMQRVT